MVNDEGSHSPSDAELAARFLQGDGQALEELWHRYAGLVWKCCYRVTKNRDDADELAQDTLVRAACKMRLFLGDREKSNFKGWIEKMAVRLAINRSRSKNKPIASLWELDDARAPEESNPVRALQNEEYRQAVRKIVDGFQEPIRTCFVEFYFLGTPKPDLARIHTWSLQQVEYYLRRGRELFRNRGQRLFDDDETDK